MNKYMKYMSDKKYVNGLLQYAMKNNLIPDEINEKDFNNLLAEIELTKSEEEWTKIFKEQL